MSAPLFQKTFADAPETVRTLGQLDGCFADEKLWQERVSKQDHIVYTVKTVAPGNGPGDLHLGIGTLYPGKIGDEYFMTKGHLHSNRESAEWYIGLSGRGLMLLQSEETDEVRSLPLEAGEAVYVPGFTAHRTVNTGDTPLIYLGLYSALAGHDYGFVKERNFSHVIIERDGEAVCLPRDSR